MDSYTIEFEKETRDYQRKLDKVAIMETNQELLKLRQIILTLLSFFKEDITQKEIIKLAHNYYIPKWLKPSRDITQFIKIVKGI